MSEAAVNREQWLSDAVANLSGRFAAHGYQLSPVAISVGFPSSGGLGTAGGSKAIGECWGAECSSDGRPQVFVSPLLAEPVRVLDVVVHELVHAAVGVKAGHGPRFRQAAARLGLAGKATATYAGPDLERELRDLAACLGPYPHPQLSPRERPKPQSTRLIKCTCPCCGYVVRTTRKWLERGAPRCPEGVGMTWEAPEDDAV